MPDTTLITVKAAAVSAVVAFGIATATVPGMAAPPGPGTSIAVTSEEGGHSHDPAPTPQPTPQPPAETDHGDHTTPPTGPTEPADRPRAWVFGGFAVVNGVALTYAAWLRRRTAPDRNRHSAARTAAQAREVSSR